jgi:hypothetical protein
MASKPEKGDAFALAGLGGFNAHGAGFLAAAQRRRWIPDLVTATSGQILVVARWLQDKNLEDFLVDRARESDPFAQVETAFLGYPGVFRPAYIEAIRRMWTPPAPNDSLIDIVADRLLPAQTCVSLRDDRFFAEVADTLNNRPALDGKEIGVVFNTYDPGAGVTRLYGNDRARALFPTERKLSVVKSAGARPQAAAHPEIELLPITPEAVKAALWLSLYGFDGLPNGQMDGAYFRSCIVSELYGFQRIFVVRPLAQGWRGKSPGNWFDVQDWQCEMWFSAGYRAELEGLKRINQLIDQGHLKSDKFEAVEIHEIEPETPAGYFNYFIEHDAVYRRAYQLADDLFASLAAEGRRAPEARPAPPKAAFEPRPARPAAHSRGDGGDRPEA